jgi:hypothetical protein
VIFARQSLPVLVSRGPLLFLATIFVASRAFFLAVGAVGHAYLVQAVPAGSPLQPPGFLNYWAHWDGAWYAAIATRGYYDAASPAFFPAYPGAVAGLNFLPGGPSLWGVVVSTVAFGAAIFFLYGLAEHLFDRATARATAIAFAFFPTAFFFNAVYTEALFVALAAGSVWALRVRRNVFVALLLAYFATATRSIGVLLLVPLAYELIARQRRRVAEAVPALVLAAGGFIAWMVYLWRRYGSPLYFQDAEKKIWGRHVVAPWHTLARGWNEAVDGVGYAFRPTRVFSTASALPPFKVAGVADLLALVLAVVLLVVAWRMLPVELWAYSLLVLLPPVLEPSPVMALMSMPRYVLAAFPLFIVLGRLLARSRVAVPAYAVASGAIGVYLTFLFTSWRWIA